MNKQQALRTVFKKSPLGEYLRINKHRFLKGTLSDKTASSILKSNGFKKTQEEQWEEKIK